MKFYPHHIGDFIKDTARLNDSQSMAYLRLIWEYYANEMPLDNDCNAIAFKIGSSASDVEQILRHFFFLHDGKWHQSRCDTVIAEFYAKSEKARNSANIRWEEKKKNANALRTHNERNANEPKNDATHNPIPISKPKVKDYSRAPRFDAQAHLVSLGVDEQIASDWITLRRAKKAPPTLRAIAGIANEAIRAGRPLPDVLEVCCNRGWTGFKAEWITKDQPTPARPINGRQAAISNYAAQAAEARAKSVPIIIERDITGEVIRVA